MNPEFYVVLEESKLKDTIADIVFEAGFDDSEFTMRGGRAAIWVCHRQGELTDLVREALAQTKQAGLNVSHVEIESAVSA